MDNDDRLITKNMKFILPFDIFMLTFIDKIPHMNVENV